MIGKVIRTICIDKIFKFLFFLFHSPTPRAIIKNLVQEQNNFTKFPNLSQDGYMLFFVFKDPDLVQKFCELLV